MFSEPIFSLGYGPTVDTLEDVDINDPKYNLRYNRNVDLQSFYHGVDDEGKTIPIYTEEPDHLPVDTLNTIGEGGVPASEQHPTNPIPKVDDIMKLGDSLPPEP